MPTAAARPPRRAILTALLVLALVVGAWTYIRVLYGHAIPVGPYYSDLYPSWEGTRALLWEGRDPYSPEVTASIQRGVLGRVLAPGDPDNQYAFPYPLPIVFLVAPLTLFPYDALMPILPPATGALIMLGVWLWLGALDWRPGRGPTVALVVLGASMPPAIQTALLHQPTAWFAALMAGAGVALVRKHYTLAGALLALAAIKPQVSILLILWLILWAVSDWRRRGGLLVGFAGTGALLLIGSWLLLPGWVGAWLTLLQGYQVWAADAPILAAWLPPALVPGVQIGMGLALALLAGRSRHAAPGSLAFSLMLALTTLYSILLIAAWTAYNQIMLFPAALLLLQQRDMLAALGRGGRMLAAASVSLLVWPLPAMGVWVLVYGAGVLLGLPALRETAILVVRAPWVIGLVTPLALVVPLGVLAWPILRRGLAAPTAPPILGDAPTS